jgi:hypothetical protein
MKRQTMPKSKLCNPWPNQKRKANRMAIEWDLKTYQAMRKEIDDMLQEIDDIAAPSAVDVRSSIYSIPHKVTFEPRQLGDQPQYIPSHPTRNESDPTASKAEQIRKYRESRLSGTEYRETVRRVNAIERVMERLERSSLKNLNQLADLVKRWYFEQEDISILMEEFCISKTTLYRWRDTVINKIAKEIGFIV